MPRKARPLLYPIPEGLSADRIRRLTGLSGADASRYKRAGALPLDVADRLATALDTHIDIMWPECAWIDEWLEKKAERNRRWVMRWMRDNLPA